MAGSTQEKMILMAQMASEGDTPGKLLFIQKYFPLAFFFLTASVISWLTVVYTQEWEAQLEEEVAMSLSSAYSADLKASFDQLIHDAQIVKGLVDASEFVSDEEFDVFTQALLTDNRATEVSAMLNYRGLNYITSLGRADSAALLPLLKVPENGQQMTQIIRRQAGLLDDYVIRYFPLGDAIPLGARIVAVANDYDNLLLPHNFMGKALQDREAYNVIVKESGKRYDPEVVTAFDYVYDQILEIHAKNMQVTLPVSKLKSGMVLSNDLVNHHGIVMLVTGRKLTEGLIEKLAQFEEAFATKLQVPVRHHDKEEQ